ncbi:MAG: hypothetical protein OXC41_00260 [Gammaproteobacteria bacterium]|nr:hypothetical protein [Gammaproteobacteria bacterium]
MSDRRQGAEVGVDLAADAHTLASGFEQENGMRASALGMDLK